MSDLLAPETDTRSQDVLIVEDSPVTRDLVKLVLTQSGHNVQLASTGTEALAALRERAFDVVLTDFHLPDITGLDVVRTIRDELHEGERPYFLAMTADIRSLLADQSNCEIFDRVVTKPLNIDQICEIVQTPVPPPRAPDNRRDRDSRHPLDDLGYALLHWPPRPGPAPPPGLEGIDAIVIDSSEEIDTLWSMPGANLLPCIDMTGRLGHRADIDAGRFSFADVARLGLLIDGFHERRADLHAELYGATDPADRLLARMVVRGAPLEARLSPAVPGLAVWNCLADPAAIPRLMDRLAAEELVTLEFHERLHVCPTCRSARVVVREQCPSCRSSDLSEASYLHHFVCAHQAPEEDFAQGDALVCPKCRRELRHFGAEYDRPGVVIRCNLCGHTTPEPDVGFVCVDCGSAHPAETMPTADIHGARLTETGKACARSGRGITGPTRSALRFADLPLDIILRLNRAAADYTATHVPFCLVQISFDGFEDAASVHGARVARDARRIWREAFRQALGGAGHVATARTFDAVFLPETERAAAADRLADPIAKANAAIRLDLAPHCDHFGPTDFAT